MRAFVRTYEYKFTSALVHGTLTCQPTPITLGNSPTIKTFSHPQTLPMSIAHPPLRKHTTHRIPPSTALTLISSYLQASTTNPSLHPDALLTESGPLSASTDGLTLHNLRRIQAGLRGDNLGADLTFSKFGGQGLPDLHHAAGGAPGPIISGTGRRDDGGADEVVVEGWQDREEFEREQEVVVGADGGRSEEMMKRGKGSGVWVLEEEDEVDDDDEDRPIGGGGGVGGLSAMVSGRDKEERKRRKKERKKNDAREREMRRKRERDAE